VFYDIYLDLCKRNNKKPSVVASELGINKSNVSNWKNNGYTPRGDALNKIAEYFGVSTDYLLGAEENTDTVISNISQYQALLSWILDNEGVSDEIKHVIRDELPKDPMAALSALSYQAGVRFDCDIKKLPTLISENGQSVNIVKIAGRDGSYMEKQLGDKELQALKSFIDLLPDASDDL